MQLATMQSSMGGQALTMRSSPAQPSRTTFHCVARKQLTPKESRIGKALIPVPQGVTVTIDGKLVAVKVHPRIPPPPAPPPGRPLALVSHLFFATPTSCCVPQQPCNAHCCCAAFNPASSARQPMQRRLGRTAVGTQVLLAQRKQRGDHGMEVRHGARPPFAASG